MLYPMLWSKPTKPFKACGLKGLSSHLENNIFLYIFISVTDHVIIHVYNECDAQDDTIKV